MSKGFKKRIIFLDLMRALAVLMMVQGHTVDTFLADEYRTYDSNLYSIWLTLRGFTAPIFMFTSGVVFTYLLRLNPLPFFENPRVRKGLKRFLLLVVVAYMLRFPTPRMIDFSQVTHAQWLTFFTVDALHLIGFGILFILCLVYIVERTSANFFTVFTLGFLFFWCAYPYINSVNWANYMPLPFAAYIYQGSGSLFPFFPWVSYVLAGGMLGNYLAQNPDIFRSAKFSYKLFGVGALLVVLAIPVNLFDQAVLGFSQDYFTDGFSLVLARLGMVIMLNGLMSLASIRLHKIPEIINNVGKNTLLVYVVHVIILYGSAWIPGFGMFWPKSLNILWSVLAAIALIALMFGMVAVLEYLKSFRKRKLAALGI
jgi:uncharacterized membrane protein